MIVVKTSFSVGGYTVAEDQKSIQGVGSMSDNFRGNILLRGHLQRLHLILCINHLRSSPTIMLSCYRSLHGSLCEVCQSGNDSCALTITTIVSRRFEQESCAWIDVERPAGQRWIFTMTFVQSFS